MSSFSFSFSSNPSSSPSSTPSLFCSSPFSLSPSSPTPTFSFANPPSSSSSSSFSLPGFSSPPSAPIFGSTSFGSVISGPFSSVPTSTTSLFGSFSSSSSSGLFSTTTPTSTNWIRSFSYSSSNSNFSGSYTTTTTALFSSDLFRSSYSGSVCAKTDSIPSSSSPFSFRPTTASAPKTSTTASAKPPRSGVFGSVGPPHGGSFIVKVEEMVDEVEEVNAEVEQERDGLAKQPIVSNVEQQAEGISSAVSEAGACGAGRQTFCFSAPFVDVNGYYISAQNGPIAKQIFDKFGDITEGSMINSVAVKSGLLELIANAVYKLCNHTMKSLGLDELRLMEQHTADAVAVGFHVDWLQQRIENVIAASDYYVHLMELDKLAKQIDDAEKSLMEMELKHAIWMNELAAIKDKMEENGFGESKLGDGLL